ncbi:hypothetical protein HK101_008077 [Irineochytrium annulatum]|nr:hypothetical protein HK101_008077 [Irineochytrium annulatum]
MDPDGGVWDIRGAVDEGADDGGGEKAVKDEVASVGADMGEADVAASDEDDEGTTLVTKGSGIFVGASEIALKISAAGEDRDGLNVGGEDAAVAIGGVVGGAAETVADGIIESLGVDGRPAVLVGLVEDQVSTRALIEFSDWRPIFVLQTTGGWSLRLTLLLLAGRNRYCVRPPLPFSASFHRAV